MNSKDVVVTERLELTPQADNADFAKFYASGHPAVVAALRVALGSSELARDCAAEGFARALADWKRVQRLDHPLAWTTRVALNHGRRTLRRAAIERRLLIGKAERPAELPPELVDRELWSKVQKLPPRQRMAIALRYVESLTQAEVAERMGIRPGTAGALLAQGRQALRESLVGDEG